MKVLIIGGNAAGMSAASKLKRSMPQTQVVVFERGEETSYGACGLPYYISGENPDIDLVRIRKPDAFLQEGIDLRLRHTVASVDTEAKTVAVLNGAGGEAYEETYDRLIIASGAAPIVPNWPGVSLKNIFSLKTISDAEAIKRCLAQPGIRRVAIVGGGYIGLEIAEACIRLKKEVRILEAAPHCLPAFDPEFGAAVKRELENHGAQVHTGERVAAFTGEEALSGILTESGARYEADAAIIAIGVRPNTRFFRPEQIHMLGNGALIVDAAMRTSATDIYAAGDCATVYHRLLDAPVYLPLATNANKQGRLAAVSVLGGDVSLKRALGTSMLRCLKLEFGKTGLTQAEAQAHCLRAKSITIQAKTHARYYPGSADITIRLCYNSETKVILGAQLMGEKETAWRTDVLACAIDRGMTTEELGYLDLAYSPIYASVWDPILIAANAAK
ncbi:MAG: CoA-disulfide reductase [Christensenellaceae bacterium]|jgi:NADPH-dependent 2,4-dienoyl-CoA reductase/sulfur reductase-like enzyme|nr:CoA-disulfide reductase [Christensenellaceae bacterium]